MTLELPQSYYSGNFYARTGENRDKFPFSNGSHWLTSDNDDVPKPIYGPEQ